MAVLPPGADLKLEVSGARGASSWGQKHINTGALGGDRKNVHRHECTATFVGSYTSRGKSRQRRGPGNYQSSGAQQRVGTQFSAQATREDRWWPACHGRTMMQIHRNAVTAIRPLPRLLSFPPPFTSSARHTACTICHLATPPYHHRFPVSL